MIYNYSACTKINSKLCCTDYPIKVIPFEIYGILYPGSYGKILSDGKICRYVVIDGGSIFGLYNSIKEVKRAVRECIEEYELDCAF